MKIQVSNATIDLKGEMVTAILEAGETLQLTTPLQHGQTCVYVLAQGGKLSIEGGSETISKIKGPGMAGKVEGAPSHSDKERALMIVIQRIIARYNQGCLNDRIFKLFELAKCAYRAESEAVFQAVIADLQKL